jgi:hypothetical protein
LANFHALHRALVLHILGADQFLGEWINSVTKIAKTSDILDFLHQNS